MLPNVKHTAIAALTALSIAIIPATQAAAWGQREQDVLKGLVGTIIVQGLIREAKRGDRNQPVYQEPSPRPRHDYEQPAPRPHVNSIYRTAAARAFNSYSKSERRLIQKRLAHWGYYRGPFDGSFGPGTYSAVAAYAADEGQSRDLASTAGAYGVYDGLIY